MAFAQNLLRLVQARLLGEQIGEAGEHMDSLVVGVPHVGEDIQRPAQFGLGLVVTAQGLKRTEC